MKQVKEERNGRSLERRVYSHEEYINLVLQNGNVMSHDYSQESTDEDPRMMAFFDSLVQRELDGWSSDDSMSSNEEALYSRIVQLSQSDIDSDDSIFDLGDNDTEDPAYSPFTVAFASVMASQAVEGNENFPRLNRALETAERIYAEASDDHEAGQTSEDINHSQNLENFGQRSVSNVDEENTSHRELTTLIKRKKIELRESMKRKLKYPLAEIVLSSSDENDDVCGIDDSSVSSLNIVIGEDCQESSREKTMSLCKTLEVDNILVVNTQAHTKLQRLKNLRKSVMNSESDTSDIEIHEKKLPVEALEPGASNSSKSEDTFERVQFKKFKRRSATNKTAKETDTNGLARSRYSPDFGPFLQKAGTSTSIEVRQTSREEENGIKKGKQSSDTSKSKHKSNSDHNHFYKQATNTYDSKHTNVSEQTRNTDSEIDFLKMNSSHPKHRHYRDNKDDHTDGKADISHGHTEEIYDRKGSESAKSYSREHRERDGRDSHRYAAEERNYDFKNGKESSYNKKGDKTDLSHRHGHDRTRIKHNYDKNIHEREVKNDGKTDSSQKHANEKTSHRFKDCKDSPRHEHEFKIDDHINGKMEKDSQRHRQRSKSDFDSGFEKRRCKYYAERSENQHIHEHSHERQDNILDEKSHGWRKSTYCKTFERKHQTSDSDDNRRKRQKQTHRKFSDEIIVDGDKSDDWHSRRNDLAVSKRGHSESNRAHIELQLTEKCKECAKLKGNEIRYDCDSEDRDLSSDKDLCEQCKCLLDNTNKAVTLVSDRKLKIDCENSDIGSESDDEKKKSPLMKNSKYVCQTREPEPSCSFSIMSENIDNAKSDERNNSGKFGIKTKVQKIKDSQSEDSDTEGHSQDDSKKDTADSTRKRDSSSNEDDQLTWLEFKRFKNRLERARKRYTEEKHQRRNESRHSDNK